MIPFVQNSRKCQQIYADKRQICGCVGPAGVMDSKGTVSTCWDDGSVLYFPFDSRLMVAYIC